MFVCVFEEKDAKAHHWWRRLQLCQLPFAVERALLISFAHAKVVDSAHEFTYRRSKQCHLLANKASSRGQRKRGGFKLNRSERKQERERERERIKSAHKSIDGRPFVLIKPRKEPQAPSILCTSWVARVVEHSTISAVVWWKRSNLQTKTMMMTARGFDFWTQV